MNLTLRKKKGTHRRLGGIFLPSYRLAGPEEEHRLPARGGDRRGSQAEVGAHKLCRPEGAAAAPADHLRLRRRKRRREQARTAVLNWWSLRTHSFLFFPLIKTEIDSELLKFSLIKFEKKN